MNVVTIIPVRDEEKHIGKVVSDARRYCDTVLVVDDGSTDSTALVAKKAGAQVLKLSKNKGKGFAMRIGIDRALKDGADAVVFMDGDEQHRAEDIPTFVNALKGHDIVFGERTAGEMPPIKKFGNWFLNNLFSILFKSDSGDLLCGFKAMNRKTAEELKWRSNGYSVEIEMATKAAMKKLKFARVKIPIIYMDAKKGTGVVDGLWIGLNIVKFRLLR